MSSGEGSQGLTGWWSSGGMEHVPTMHSFSPPRGPPSPQIVVLIGIAHALVIYRVIATALFAQSDSEFLREQANTMAVMTGAVLHYITIVIMTKVRSETRGGQRVFSLLFLHQPPPVIVLQVNRRVALYLCELGKGNWGLSPTRAPQRRAARQYPGTAAQHPLGPRMQPGPWPLPFLHHHKAPTGQLFACRSPWEGSSPPTHKLTRGPHASSWLSHSPATLWRDSHPMGLRPAMSRKPPQLQESSQRGFPPS